jgi:hypothetical protein
MRIPPDATIAMEKLTAYLLVLRQEDDKSKFLAQAAFTKENPHLLLEAIRRLAASVEAVEDRRSDYGTFLRAEGQMTGPNGRSLPVVTIWLESAAADEVRFVTLKPWKEKLP